MTHILVIEDDADLREGIIDMLRVAGYMPIGAEDGLKGVAEARASLPALILCDIMMPGLDGYGVLAELSRDSRTATIPFLFLTARTERADLRRGMELGADDYIPKPFTRSELLKAVETRLTKHAAVNARYRKKFQELCDGLVLALPHELRTPLVGILTGSELLLEQPDDVRELAEIIHSSALRLNHLVMNYLLYAEIELLLAEPARVQTLRQLRAMDAAGAVRWAATAKANELGRGDDLQLDLFAGPAGVDERHLEHIVVELVENACKFSRPHTPVHVSASGDGDRFSVTVVDHGRGMTAEQIDQIGALVQFERKVYEQQGTGIGLVIASRLAKLYGGDLVIDSVPQQGTRVLVTLPA